MMSRTWLAMGAAALACLVDVAPSRAAEPLLLEAYCESLSVRPGEEVRFHVSTNAQEYGLDIFRVGWRDELAYSVGKFPGKEHPVGDDTGKPGQAAMFGCRWPVSVRVGITEKWRPGFYRALLRAGGETRGDLPEEPFSPIRMSGQPNRFVLFFAVRPPDGGPHNKILLELASNTYQAYNSWGGSSLYSGPSFPRVSFDRPMTVFPWASPVTWEMPFIRWMERNGYGLDICTNLDLQFHPELLAHYRLVVSVGHDEYWSAGMRDNLEAFIAKGGNCAFLSGNTCCWQVRVEDEGRALVCHKRYVENDPVWKQRDRRLLTTLWSDPLLKRPENLLTGVGFPYGGYNGIYGSYENGPGEGEYTVHRPDHWLLAGTGLKRGDQFGKQASIAGYEMDGCEFIVQDGLPVPTGRDGTPKELQIVATAPGHWGQFDNSIDWAREIRAALPVTAGQELPASFLQREGCGVLGTFTRGGSVVTAGSTDWVQGLAAGDPLVERITHNLIEKLSGEKGRPLPVAANFPPKSPPESLACFVPRAGMKVELVAAEPLTMDPVDIAWGPDGRLWVVEMADYPLGLDGQGKPGGRVRYLEDINGDGVYDKSTLFLDGLNFANGVMPWRKGVLVTSAPEVFYAEDTDGDGRADLRRPLYAGFGEGNQQHRVNHPRWGLDNCIYLANGDGGAGANGVVRSLLKRGLQLDIRGRDLRIRPDDGLLDTVAGQAQYGRNRDDWGNWFGCNNNDPAWFYAVDDCYIRRNPHVAAPPGRVTLSGDRTSFPAGWVVTHHAKNEPCPPLGQPGSWTSLSGVAVYRDELLGEAYRGNVFVCDSVYNVVHRKVLTPQGVLFRGERAADEGRSEFLATTDPWFRPTTVHTGPDGALWVVDMARFVIEHPEWINDDLEATLDLRLGHDKGRIWRVYPSQTQPRSVPRLDKFDTAGLVAALDSPNGWQRDMAQQMLLWRADTAAVPLLENLAGHSQRALARLHALCTLDGLGRLRPEVVIGGLADGHPGVRRHAVRLSEGFLGSSPKVAEALLRLLDDPDPQVQMQLAYSLGEWPDPRAGQALAKFAMRHSAEPYMAAAAFSSAMPHVATMIAVIQAEAPKSEARDQLLAKLAKLEQDIKTAPQAVQELAAKRGEPPEQIAERVIGKAKTQEEVQKTLESFKAVLTLAGDSQRGKQMFVEATCSNCHRLGDVGTEIGPDLTCLVDRSPQVLLTAVVDPNRAVVAKYLEQIAVTKQGRTFRGMLLEETGNSITLVDLAGKSQVILRRDIEELVCTGRSHMPEKLEGKLNPQQMADLFAFVRSARPAPRPPTDRHAQVVVAEADGTLRLLAHYSEIHAGGVTFDKQQGCLVWHRRQPTDHVAWLVDVPQSGSYEVAIQWTQIPEYADNPFAIEAGSSRLESTFPSTGGWGKWQTRVFGTLALPAGRQRVVLRPNGPIKEELSDLREIRLQPVRPDAGKRSQSR